MSGGLAECSRPTRLSGTRIVMQGRCGKRLLLRYARPHHAGANAFTGVSPHCRYGRGSQPKKNHRARSMKPLCVRPPVINELGKSPPRPRQVEARKWGVAICIRWKRTTTTRFATSVFLVRSISQYFRPPSLELRLLLLPVHRLDGDPSVAGAFHACHAGVIFRTALSDVSLESITRVVTGSHPIGSPSTPMTKRAYTIT